MSTLKKILFISYDGMTDPLGQSQVIPYLKGISADGYEIFLLTCEKNQVFKTNRETVLKLLDGFNIRWVPLSYTKKPPVFSTLFDVIKLKRAASKIHKEHQINMVHTRAGVPALVGLWMKKKFGIKFLNDIREFYADSRVDGGMWNTKNIFYGWIYQYFKKQESEQVKLSDGMVCLTYAAEKIIQQWPEYNKNIPLTVIPCSADLALFDPAALDQKAKEKFAETLNINKEDFIISYLGSIGGWYLTAEMMQFCKRLSDQVPSAKFLFISPHRHDQITAAAVKYGIPPEKVISTHAKRADVPVLLSFSNYSIFFIRPCYSKQSSSPTKHGEIMAMGIPVITNSGVGDVEMIVKRYHAGFVVDDFSSIAFEKVISKLSTTPLGESAGIRTGAVEFYALDSAVEKYRKLYRQILNNAQ